MSGQFFDKVVLVTGASSGIGRASAQMFAKEGAKVVVADIGIEGGEETVSLIKSAGGEATFVRVDVSNARDVETMVHNTIEIYSRLNYAINNAGVESENAGTVEHSEKAWDRILDINLKGMWLCMKYEIPEILKQGGGVIVNVSSISGLIGGGGTVAYTASKHGVVGLTKAVALEFAKQGIRVNAICPGIIRTPMADRVLASHPGMEAQLTALEPIGRLAAPEEVAQAAIWLCSDAASFVTGISMPVDGGWVAR